MEANLSLILDAQKQMIGPTIAVLRHFEFIYDFAS
jgi:hypothetical protein